MTTITEQEFEKLCDDVYADRSEIYTLNPNASRRETVLWMLLGCLISLLSVTVDEQTKLLLDASLDPYGDAICKLLGERAQPMFDPQPYIAELSKRIESY